MGNVIIIAIIVVLVLNGIYCKNRVEKSINDIDGAAAKVNLKKKEAIVSLEKDVSDEQILVAVEKAGYTVVSIR